MDNDQDDFSTAYHEAGHAWVLYWHFVRKGWCNGIEIEIEPETGHLGRAMARGLCAPSPWYWPHYAAYQAAGLVAEGTWGVQQGRFTWPEWMQRTGERLQSEATDLGESHADESLYEGDFAQWWRLGFEYGLPVGVEEYWEGWRMAEQLVRADWPAVETLAHALLSKRKLMAEEVLEICKARRYEKFDTALEQYERSLTYGDVEHPEFDLNEIRELRECLIDSAALFEVLPELQQLREAQRRIQAAVAGAQSDKEKLSRLWKEMKAVGFFEPAKTRAWRRKFEMLRDFVMAQGGWYAPPLEPFEPAVHEFGKPRVVHNRRMRAQRSKTEAFKFVVRQYPCKQKCKEDPKAKCTHLGAALRRLERAIEELPAAAAAGDPLARRLYAYQLSFNRRMPAWAENPYDSDDEQARNPVNAPAEFPYEKPNPFDLKSLRNLIKSANSG